MTAAPFDHPAAQAIRFHGGATPPGGVVLRSGVRRFTDGQAELAQKISNDIAENIDCGESRESLRMAVAYWADQACAEARCRAAAEAQLETLRAVKKFMDGATPSGGTVSSCCHGPVLEEGSGAETWWVCEWCGGQTQPMPAPLARVRHSAALAMPWRDAPLQPSTANRQPLTTDH